MAEDAGPPLWWKDAPIDANYECNFCTASPDKVLGVSLKPACRTHDWFYDNVSIPYVTQKREEGVKITRKTIDKAFQSHIEELFGFSSSGKVVGAIYYSGVRLFGKNRYDPGAGHRSSGDPAGRIAESFVRIFRAVQSDDDDHYLESRHSFLNTALIEALGERFADAPPPAEPAASRSSAE